MLILAAEKNNDRHGLKGLLRAVVDVIEWRPDPENPKKGSALIQLWELPRVFWEDKKEQPSEPINDGSLSRVKWLPDVDDFRTAVMEMAA